MPLDNSPPKSAREICEALLKEKRSELVDQAIWPSLVKVINRLLARGLELGEAYDELHSKLFGGGFEGRHDALGDVRATARCYFELQVRGIV